jgi:hypothetical protein
MVRADRAWRRELEETSIADLVDAVAGKAPPQAVVKAAAWFTEAMR